MPHSRNYSVFLLRIQKCSITLSAHYAPIDGKPITFHSTFRTMYAVLRTTASCIVRRLSLPGASFRKLVVTWVISSVAPMMTGNFLSHEICCDGLILARCYQSFCFPFWICKSEPIPCVTLIYSWFSYFFICTVIVINVFRLLLSLNDTQVLFFLSA